jgi:twitching motility two-component system response regulator PilG
MSKLVMIIDDSLTVRKIIETSLKREGFESVSYPDGIEAIRALNEKRHRTPDLVILDIGLPKMDGYEVARHLKTKSQFGFQVASDLVAIHLRKANIKYHQVRCTMSLFV